jgi:hypothetical protein
MNEKGEIIGQKKLPSNGEIVDFLKGFEDSMEVAIEVAWRLGGHGVMVTLMDVVQDKGIPKSIRIDNGPEFTAKAIRKW